MKPEEKENVLRSIARRDNDEVKDKPSLCGDGSVQLKTNSAGYPAQDNEEERRL